MKKIFVISFLFLFLLTFPTDSFAVISCEPPLSGDYTLNTDDCLWANTVDGVDAGTGSTNTARITIGTGRSMTIQANQTISFGEIVLENGATLAISKTNSKMQKAPLWIKDSDTDGYPDSQTLDATYAKVQTAQPAGFVRKKDLSTLASADCSILDNTVWREETLYYDADSDGYGLEQTPTRRSYNSSIGSSTTIILSKPTGTVEGDVIVAALNFGGMATVTPPANWNLIRRVDNDDSTNDVSLAVYYKIATGSEPTSYTFTFSMSLTSAGIITSYYSMDTASLVDTSNSQTSGSTESTTQTFTVPSITTSYGQEYIVAFAANYATNTGGTWTNDLGNGLTEFTERTNSRRMIQGADVVKTSAGATGTYTAAPSLAAHGATVIVGLKSRAGYNLCYGASPPANRASSNSDCNDSNASVYQNLTGYTDSDNDTYTTGASQQICSGASLPAGYQASANGSDCNDSDNTKWQNINGYTDADGDGHGVGSLGPICSGATLASGYTSVNNTDCNDGNASIYQNLTCYSTGTTFNYTGSQQTYVVPVGVTSARIEAYGAAGGNGVYTNTPGYGGKASAIFTTTPGETLYIYVGNQGGSGGVNVGAGGWNGGASGGTSSYYQCYDGGGGGGSSDVRRGGTALANRIIVGGAGGGAAGDCPWGGGAVGGNGANPDGERGGDSGGYGGTQSAGGGGGPTYSVPNSGAGSSGSLGTGGSGGSGTGGGGGGGAAGYYGGGGGASGGGTTTYDGGRGGGGGSSWVSSTGTSEVSYTSGVNSGAGYIIIYPSAVTCTGATCP